MPNDSLLKFLRKALGRNARFAVGAALLVGVATLVSRGMQAPPASTNGELLPRVPQVTPVNGITTLTLTALTVREHGALFSHGSFVPPTLRVVDGGRLRITYVNDMSRHSKEQCAIGPCKDATNLHFHGMEVSPQYGQDDVVTMLATPGQTLHYDVQIPRDVPPGLYWYHTHPDHESDRQALDGMSGAIVVEGIDRYVPQLRQIPERVLILRTTEFGHNDPTFRFMMHRLDVGNGSACHTKERPEQLFTVNRAFRPSIPIAPGERQFWRIVNASADLYTDLSIDGSSMQVVAFDGDPLALHDASHPTRIYNHVVLPPAGRVEAIVTGPPAGIHATLRMHCVDSGPDGDPMPAQVLADIVADRGDPRPPPLPAQNGPATYHTVENLARLEHSQPAFVATLTEGHHRFYINKQLYSSTAPPMATVPVGSYVHWRIRNDSDEIHPFHIHQVHFMTYAINGKYVANPIWADTMDVPLKQSIDVILDATFVHIRGMSVFHCHILSHEDKGMMAKVLFK